MPMDHAYKVLHMDELMQGTLAGAVQRTQQRTLETIAARGMRPAENGVGMSAERAGKIRHQQAEPREDGGTGAPERTGRADHPGEDV